MINNRIKLNFFVARVFRKIGLIDKKKYRAYLNVLNIISNHKGLTKKDVSLINKVRLSYQNKKNTVRVEVYFKNREKYVLDLNNWDYVLPEDKIYSLKSIKRSLYLILGDTKRNGIKYELVAH